MSDLTEQLRVVCNVDNQCCKECAVQRIAAANRIEELEPPPFLRTVATMVKNQALEGREVLPNSAATLALWVLGELETDHG